MSQIVILVIEDEPEVRDAIARDLKPFAEHFRVEVAEDVADAKQIIMECEDEGDRIGLALCDHLLPGENGVEFLVELNNDPRWEAIRKVLVTGQAGQQDTIKAVNQADLDYYIAKPWEPEELHKVVKDELTYFVIQQEDDLMPYVAILDGPAILEAISNRGSDE